MPWKIEELDGKYAVVKEDDGSVVGTHASRAKAEAQLRALYASESGKGLDLSYAKSLGIATLPDLTVKSTGQDEIHGYLALWGDPKHLDLDREYFTKGTDFWDKQLTLPRPLTWDHGQDPATKAAPIIGRMVEFGDDDLGRWYTAQLDRSHKYRKVVDELIKAGLLGTSSDSAPQYVVREKAKSGATWLKQWPLFAAALTNTPCDPRQVGTLEYFKSIGIELPDTDAPPDAARGRLEIARAKIQVLSLQEVLYHD